jgi:FkbM family methyltransferase
MSKYYIKNINNISANGDIGGFQETVIRQIYTTWILKSGNVAIDIGAHLGLHTIQMAHCVGESGIIYSIEACPDLISAVQHQLDDKGIRNVRLTHAAVGLRNGGFIKFYKNIENPGQSTIVKGYGNNFTDQYSYDVPLINLDSLEPVIGRRLLRFIKIDAEGAELQILKGGIQLLTAHTPLIAAEVSIHLFKVYKEEFNKFLHDAGYSAFTLLGDELSDQVVEREKETPLYTLLLAKRGHWTHDFCSNPDKLKKLTLNLSDRWALRSKS